MTFNYYYTHKCLSAVFKKKNNIDAFYQKVLLDPDNLHGFLVNSMEVAAKNADEDVEPPFDADLLKMYLYGTVEKGIVYIVIPEWGQSRDCVVIAFPTDPNKAGYYTCEYSVSPFDNSEHFYLGQWATGCDDVRHDNWGEITPATHDEFLQKLYELVYE